MVWQLTPSCRPTVVQVSPEVTMVPTGALPAKLRNLEAMLDEEAELRSEEVSYQPVLWVVELFGVDS